MKREIELECIQALQKQKLAENERDDAQRAYTDLKVPTTHFA